MKTVKRFPAAPLLALLPPAPPHEQVVASQLHHGFPAEGTGPDLAQRLGVTRETIARWRHGDNQLTERSADRAAIALGLHPGLIWPEWWHVAFCDCRPTDDRCDCDPDALEAR